MKVKKYNELNFVINQNLRNKIFKVFKFIQIDNVFKNIKLQKELNNTNLENLFIKNLEDIINVLSKTYIYYIKQKKNISSKLNKKLSNQNIKEILFKKVKKRIENNFGKKNARNIDIKLLILVYDSINKINIIDIIKVVGGIKGGSEEVEEPGFFSSDPDFPESLFPDGMSIIDKILTYGPIIYYLENKWPWLEYVFLLLDTIIDIVGLIPAVGDLVDLVGLVICILRKDWVGAILQAIAVIPVAGSILNTPVSVIRNIMRGFDKYNEFKAKVQLAKDVVNTAKEVVAEVKEITGEGEGE